ncbi:hypothetical protein N2152v2_007959 [Parachlorella kessleri]
MPRYYAATGSARPQPRAALGSVPRQVPRPADYKERVLKQFNQRAEAYDTGNVYHPPLAVRLTELARLQRGETVLDVGAGTGFVSLPAAQAVGPGGHVTAVDLCPTILTKAAEKAQSAGLHNLTCLSADIDRCRFPEATYDAILSSSTVPFLPDIPWSLAQWHAWLRPGGRVAFNVPKGVGSQAFTIFSSVMAEYGHLLSDPSQQFEDEAQVRALLEAAGYSRSQLETSQEANVRVGQTPEQWAESGWRACLSMPFADLPSLLSAEELKEAKERYLASAAQLAAGFASAEGIVEPYMMLWVLAYK